MTRSLSALLPALALVAAALPARAQPAPRGGDLVIGGTVSAHVRSILGWEEHVEGSVLLYTDPDATGPGEHYVLQEAHLSWRATGQAGDCAVSGSASVTETDRAAARLSLYPDSSYEASSTAIELARDPERLTLTCGSQVAHLPAGLLEFLHVPSAGEGGAFRWRDANGTRAMDGTWGTGEPGDPRFTWHLTGEAPRPPELVVTPDAYQTWLPEGNLQNPDAPGNTLGVTAELRGGNPTAPPRAVRFRFWLSDVSAEPGVTTNWPLDAASIGYTDPDLRITGGVNVTERDPEWGAWAVTGAGTEARVTLSSYDFGGFATLHVTATLEDGTVLVGHLDDGTTAVTLPRRAAGSLVATGWKASAGAAGQEDAADTDALPAGDGFAGDGLTLYEEYRGFRVGGRHVRTRPGTKDYFLANALAGLTLPGILLFSELSGLDVHHELVIDEEFDPTVRVVNANHARAPHRVDQHGVWLARISSTSVGQAVGPSPVPGPPRTVEYVEITNLARFTGYQPGVGLTVPGALPSHVAHELFHTVGVFHHGQRDLGHVLWAARRDPETGAAVRDADGYPEVLENGAPVVVFGESGSAVPSALEQVALAAGRPTRVWVGDWHGQHSGAELCVMRYSVAAAYRRPGSLDRIWTGRERFGNQICTAPAGTGPNAPTWQPRPRFGDADPDAGGPRPQRGDCLHQIRVNDALDG